MNNELKIVTADDSDIMSIVIPSASLAQNPVLAAVLRLLYPSYSCCEKCGVPWKFCKSKSVQTTERDGTFATCDICWNTSTLDELKNYYSIVYAKQEKSISGTKYKMEHTLKHLLNCVELEYDRTNGS